MGDIGVLAISVAGSIVAIVAALFMMQKAKIDAAKESGKMEATITGLRSDLEQARSDLRSLETRTRESENHITAINEKLDALLTMVREIKEELDKE